jgi:hypothetical protein
VFEEEELHETSPEGVSLAGFRTEPVRYPALSALPEPRGREPRERRAFLLGRDC